MIDLDKLPALDRAQIATGHAMELTKLMESHMHSQHHQRVDLAAHALLVSIEAQLDAVRDALLQIEDESDPAWPEEEAAELAEEAYKLSGIKP